MKKKKDDITYEWVRGWSDRASQVHMASRSILMTSNDEDLLRRLFTFLVREKFHVWWSNIGTRFGIRVSGRESLVKWKTKIGFSDPDKAAKLARLLSRRK